LVDTSLDLEAYGLEIFCESLDIRCRTGEISVGAPDQKSLLGHTSGIKIEVKAEALDIEPDRAVAFGLLVNELVTNAIKHAFPDGTGRVVLSVEQVGNQIELTVADDGVGMQDKDKDLAKMPEKRGSDYVAIFVRQLDGMIVPSGSEETGTIVRIRLPLLLVPPGGAERVAA
jgi:two-component sensor histidine kinase